jgi:hypothetical protein
VTWDGNDLTPPEPAPLKVVALGCGHGLSASLSALRRVVQHVTAIVTVADNGGSSGRLRTEFGVLPPGDLRMALAALWATTSGADLAASSSTGTPQRADAQSRGTSSSSPSGALGDHVDGLSWVARLLGPRHGAADVGGADRHCRGLRAPAEAPTITAAVGRRPSPLGSSILSRTRPPT